MDLFFKSRKLCGLPSQSHKLAIFENTVICCYTTIKSNRHHHSFLRNLGQTETAAENDGDKKLL